MGDEVSIIEKLNALTAADIPRTDVPRSERMAALAIGAVLKGPTSDEWKKYMIEIVGNDSPKQLARLTLTEARTKDDAAVRKSAAYMVANAICTPDTTARTRLGVAAVIDQPYDD